MKTAIYLRVSTELQDVRSQRHAIEEYCEMRGYKVEPRFMFTDDGVTGKTLDRPGFQGMLAAVRSGCISRLVTFELSRMSRNFLDGLDVMRELHGYGVVVEVPGEGVVKFDTCTDQFIVAAKALVAQSERERISERTKAGLAAARARGVALGAPRGNKRALGYRKVYASELVARVLRYRGMGLSLRDIAEVTLVSHCTVAQILQRALKTG